jgi:hypothetical protein
MSVLPLLVVVKEGATTAATGMTKGTRGRFMVLLGLKVCYNCF